MRRVILAVALLVTVCLPALAQEPKDLGIGRLRWVSGNSLHKVCADPKDESFAYCQGFVTATAENMIIAAQHAFPYMPCWNPPDGTTSAQLIAIVRKYLEAHPERWQLGAVDLVHEALREAFPPAA